MKCTVCGNEVKNHTGSGSTMCQECIVKLLFEKEKGERYERIESGKC